MKYSPDATLIVVTNPLDHMTTLTAEVSGLPHNKVMGQAGMLDTARFVHFVSEVSGVDVLDIEALTLGSHGPTMMPVPSQVKVAGKPLTEVLSAEQIDAIVERTRKGGSEIVGLLKTIADSELEALREAAVAVKAKIDDLHSITL